MDEFTRNTIDRESEAKKKEGAMAMSLREMYDKHGGKITDTWSLYVDELDRVLSEFRDQQIAILEIGVQNGGSLEIWSKYFPKAQKIVGVDIEPKCGELCFADPRISVLVSDATSEEGKRKVLQRSPAFDVIIDDGSHGSSDIVRSFSRYFPVLKEGGLYIVEDLHTNYWADHDGGLHNPLSAMAFLRRLADITNYEHWRISRPREYLLKEFSVKYEVCFENPDLVRIHSVLFVNSLCIIKKAAPDNNVLGKRIIVGNEEFVTSEAKKMNRTVIHDFPANTMDDTRLDIFEVIKAHADLQEQMTKKEQALQELHTEFAADQNRLTQQLAERDGQIASLNQVVTARDGQIAGLNRTLAESNKDIVDLNQAVAERDGQLISLNQGLAERDGQIANLNQDVAERDGQITNLNQGIAERDGQIVNLNQGVAERDGQIASLNQGVAERDGQIANLNQAVAERDGQITNLNQTVAERDGQIVNLNQDVAERDGQIISLNQEVAERDGQIVSLNQEVAERDTQIISLNQEVAERDGQIAAILSSTSWRVTRPLRWVGDLLRRVRMSVRFLLSALLFAPKRFDAQWYLKQNPDVAMSGMDPYKHYILFGKKEGRRPAPDAPMLCSNKSTEFNPAATNTLIDPKDFAATILDRARFYDVAPDIHKEDFIFQFLMTHQNFSSKEDAINYYFMDGENSSKKMVELISTFLKAPPSSGEISILEFASGYGCVSRHLVKHRKYKVTPCDIHPAAISFISDKIGLQALQSAHKPEEFKPVNTYDVVFALSFFSHMPDTTWGRWLAVLFKAIKPGGILIFTTHGHISAKYFDNPALNVDGYWFRAESEQKDLDVTEYGQAIATPRYVFSKILALPDAEPCFYQQAYWWGHQDVYVVLRTD